MTKERFNKIMSLLKRQTRFQNGLCRCLHSLLHNDDITQREHDLIEILFEIQFENLENYDVNGYPDEFSRYKFESDEERVIFLNKLMIK